MTIASGFDLGQHSAGELVKILVGSLELSYSYYSPFVPIPAACGGYPKLDVLDRMSPYAGKKFTHMDSSQVTKSVASIGPVPWLSKSEADSVDFANFKSQAESLRDSWNDYTESNPNFLSLSGNRQTALLSIRFRCGGLGGDDGAYAYRRDFLKFAASGNWKKAAAQYRSWPEYTSGGGRAKQEAEMLE